MTSMTSRLATLALVLGLGAVAVSPVSAGQPAPRAHNGQGDLAVELARSVSDTLTGTHQAEVYAPTGETVDMVLPVHAARLAR